MGKMLDPNHPTGTFGNVCVYQLFGRSYIRAKSSLTRKRVLKSKAFAKTRKHASDLGRAARIGSEVYKALPSNIRERWIYQAITGEAASLLYTGKTEQEVRDLLWKKYIVKTESENETIKQFNGNNLQHSTIKSNLKLREVFQERWEKQGLPYYYFKQAWQKKGYFSRARFRGIMELRGYPYSRF